jgi:hypothetical protein
MKYDRTDVFVKPVPAWKTRWKLAVLWLYEHQWITQKVAQRLIDTAGARLA